MAVVVVIVNYNSGELLQKCIHSLELQTLLPSKVIIVDNASNDSSNEMVSSSILNLEIILLDNNVGFAKANNIALARIKNASFVALLNPDAFPKSQWLEKLMLTAKKKSHYSFFASNMLDANNPTLVDGQGDVYHISGLAWRDGHGEKYEPSQVAQHKEKEIFAACAGAALYKLDDIKNLGGFDEDFFCYMEDVDLSFRLLLAGKKGLYVPQAIVYHIGSAITGKKSGFSIYYGHRNLVWVYFKNLPLLLLIAFLPMHIILNLISIIYFFYKKQGSTILKAKYDALKGLPQVLRKRTIIQQNRVASSSYILSLMSKKLNRSKKYR